MKEISMLILSAMWGKHLKYDSKNENTHVNYTQIISGSYDIYVNNIVNYSQQTFVKCSLVLLSSLALNAKTK